jgi:transglutaminase-like putative cysteine protease
MPIAWVLVTVTTLALCATVTRFLRRSDGAADPRPFGPVARAIAIAVCLTTAVVLVGAPFGADTFSTGTSAGDSPGVSNGNLGPGLIASSSLDMTTRPRLGDDLIMTVRTDRPSFWRSQTYDEWDGTRWTNRIDDVRGVPSTGTVRQVANDLAADGPTTIRQEIRIEAPYANVLPAMPSVVNVRATMPLAQRADGSIAAYRPIGRGTTYTVQSRAFDLDEAALRASDADELPTSVRERYASTPVATDRVKELAARITRGQPTAYDKVLAIEAFLGDHTRYSLDAPLSPPGKDVVDHFLFTSKLGWCEQVASSLTVLARLSGVPARVAVGYVPDQRDPVTGRYRVLARDAHAWTEVWFPRFGWVAFDPTANIPLNGDPPSSGGVASAVERYGVWILIGIVAVVGLGPAVVVWARRRLARRRDHRRIRRLRGLDPMDPGDWPAATEVRLEDLGRRWGRARAPAETSTTYARDLAARTGAGRLTEVGTAIDRARYSPGGVDDRVRGEVAEIMAGVGPPPTDGAS